jgi:dinuclear metal center YbgI/SA1388 family protein
MSTTAKDIIDAMEAWAPAALAYDWDKVGLEIGDPGAPASRVITCLTVTENVVARAEKWGANMIVAHHPILFSALKALRTDDAHTRLCLRLVRREIACFAAHTNLDVVPGGVNTTLAESLGLQSIAPLIPISASAQVKLVTYVPEAQEASLRTALAEAGAGQIGDYSACSFSVSGMGTFRPGKSTSPFSGEKDELNAVAEQRLEMILPRALLGGVLKALHHAHPYEEPAYDVVSLENKDRRFGLGARGQLEAPMKLGEFARHVRQALKLKHVRFVGNRRKSVRSVAVCGGAGGGEMGQVPRDIDVYVTGDLKYHEADGARERGLALVDAGHVGTERGIATHIAKYLRKQVPGVEVKAVIEPEIFQVETG